MNRYMTANTKIITDEKDTAVQLALRSLRRDMEKTFTPSEEEGLKIRLVRRPAEEECFVLEQTENVLELGADSELGFVYGIYEISRRFLGVQDFWFWNDQQFERRERIEVAQGFFYRSEPYRVRLRGWFVNDEVLISAWSVDRDPKRPWEMVFETLLRCGGNMVIPGTDKNSVRYRKLASDMGLFITHHHAEPLGAEMFARAYPDLKASYAEHGNLFRKLWREGIKSQRDLHVVWNLGFRGQGDCPFWEDDPQYNTDEARGTLMSKLIRIQYDMVKQSDPDAVCCTNLYGETMELYKKGLLKLPGDVIHIWADNGFGKMVSRRQGNHNPRVSALPEPEQGGRHGIYYHVSFYDLQAANHITMLPNSVSFVRRELNGVLEHGAEDYWIVNCSNVKPHIFYLDYVAKLWRYGDCDPDQWLEKYVEAYYGKNGKEEIISCFELFSKCAVQYGSNEDDHAGEQFVNHVPRMLMTQFLKDRNKPSPDFFWAADHETLMEQVKWYEDICEEGVENYAGLLEQCGKTAVLLSGPARVLFEDSLKLQAEILYHCYQGALFTCRSLDFGFEEDYLHAFYFAGKAQDAFLEADNCMRRREHGKWHDFYRNECLADIKQSAWTAETLMGYLRLLGDGPHCWKWQREFLNSEEDKQVVLILNMENHLTHREVYELMRSKWDR